MQSGICGHDNSRKLATGSDRPEADPPSYFLSATTLNYPIDISQSADLGIRAYWAPD
jgi:hypothetical protein